MSADCPLSTARAQALPVTLLPVTISQTQTTQEQTTIASLLSLLPVDCLHDARSAHTAVTIKRMVDGRGLACPMPLLKTKVALRDIKVGESLYVVATDANSQADIAAFCQQMTRINAADSVFLLLNQRTDSIATDSTYARTYDTIFHFIITKTDNN